jgi:hypothetical protein
MDKYLIIDLDCSLLKIDLFMEQLSKSLLKQPWIFFKTVSLALSNKAKPKTFISKEHKIDCQIQPYNNKVIDIITDYRGIGYKILLSTGASNIYAHQIAKHIGFLIKSLNQMGKTTMWVETN